MEIFELSASEQGQQPSAGRGLRSLSTVALERVRRLLLEAALRHNGGDAAWRNRKHAEARDVLALSQIAPPGRFQVRWIDVTDELRILLSLGVPVARRPDANNQLRLADQAVLGLTYPREVLGRALPGTAFFDLLEPRDAWHANVGPVPPIFLEHRQVLCLGDRLPAGVGCADLILLAYGALSMQTIQIDETSPAGILNIEAARWWQQNLHRVPLTTTPFLKTDEGQARPDVPSDRDLPS